MEPQSTSEGSGLADLISLWRGRRAEGREASPAELCRDHPDLLAELERHIAELELRDALATTDDRAAADPDATRPPTTPHSVQPSTAALEGWPSFPGYELRGVLGKGGMGIVYLAFDCKRGRPVALKTLQGMDSDALYRFKREFRALANVSHPNLIPLYELISDGRVWCFTMELLEGVDLLSYVRHGGSGESGAGKVPLTTTAQFQRLREALAHLSEGIQALHEAGKLHRDVKPSNALVTPQGRAVLLDFGLAAEVGRSGVYQSTQPHLLGTIAYMSPEQAAAEPVSAATDWYSVGVILYEALAGRLPFSGDPLRILRDKVERDPPPPHELVPDVPADLDALCIELLRRDPAARPAGPEVIGRLRGAGHGEEPSVPRPAANLLLGRESQLRALEDAFRDVRAGQTVVVHVAGQSGMGKSALVQGFLERLRAEEGAVVLEGQCYEKESVPYKAFDSLVDALGHYLRQLPPLEAQVVLPRDVAALARIFPVLEGFQAEMGIHAVDIADPSEVRRRAFAALRDLLARLGDRRTLILSIDDLQWGDLDSLGLYQEILRLPDPPRLLFVGTFRSEEEQTSPFLQALLAARPATEKALDARRLAVEPLTADEGCELARRLLGERQRERSDLPAAVARESGGNPLFVYELVQHALAGAERAADLSIADVLWARVQRLAEGPRRLLEVLAVAGRPLDEREASRAAGLADDERAALADLRVHRLVRTTGAAAGEEVTTYHDRVRETVTARLDPARLRQCHHELAGVLEASGRAEPEALAFHFEGAGETGRAADYFAQAADKAVSALAFDRAAEFYQAALRLRPADAPDRRSLSIRLADALANARRGAEAAPIYLHAAESGDATEALELRRRAVEQLLWSGRLDEGMAVIHKLLHSMGTSLPRTPFRALVSILYHRFLIWLRGLKFQERTADEIPAEQRIRIDTGWSIGLGLSHVDPIRGAEFQTRYLLWALRAGEPYRIARALAMEIGHSGCGGGRTRERTAKIAGIARQLADKTGNPHGIGLAWLGDGIGAFLEGRWKATRDLCEQSAHIFREQCTGVAWERNMANFYGIRALEFLGELRELFHRLPLLLRDAEHRGDLSAATNLRTRLAYFVALMSDRPDEAQEELHQAIEQWSQQGFHLQHYFELSAQTDISHYRGDVGAAWELIEKRWPVMKRSLLLRVQTNLLTMLYLRGRSALALAAAEKTEKSQRGSLLKLVQQSAAGMERERMPWSDPQAVLLRAGVAAVDGKMDEARKLLETAEMGFKAADMLLYATVARRRRGQVIGGDEGRALVAEADAWMTGQEIRNPIRWTAMYAPGFPD